MSVAYQEKEKYEWFPEDKSWVQKEWIRDNMLKYVQFCEHLFQHWKDSWVGRVVSLFQNDGLWSSIDLY